MVAGNKTIVDYIDNCASGSPTDQELAQLGGAIQSIENGDIGYSVACVALLPDAAENTGRWVYVTDISAYRYSNGEEWTNSYDTTYNPIYSGRILAIGCDSSIAVFGNGQAATNTTTYVSAINDSTYQWCQIGDLSRQQQQTAIKTDGTLWFWGYGNDGAMWQNNKAYPSSPVQEITSATTWCKASNARGTAAIKTTGELFSAGPNFAGSRGINIAVPDQKYSSPVQEYTSSCWCDVSTGYANVYAIKTDSSLWVWGCGSSGQLGNNSAVDASSPVREITSSSWCKLVNGDGDTTAGTGAIKTDGTLWVWGTFNSGAHATNLGASLTFSSPVQEVSSSSNWCTGNVQRSSFHAIKTDGTLWAAGDNAYQNRIGLSNGVADFICYSSPTQEVTSSTNWSSVFSAGQRGGGIKTDGSLWVWGCQAGAMIDYSTRNGQCILYICQECQGGVSRYDWVQVQAPSSCSALIGLVITPKGFNEP